MSHPPNPTLILLAFDRALRNVRRAAVAFVCCGPSAHVRFNSLTRLYPHLRASWYQRRWADRYRHLPP